MSCIRCGLDEIISVGAKCDDKFSAQYKGQPYQDYVPRDIGIGGGDYITFEYCLNCGQIQGGFPIDEPEFYDENKPVEEE